MTSKGRRVLANIDRYPRPQEVLEQITTGEGWPYKIDKQEYLQRDRALVSLLYLTCCRVSEALRIEKKQFEVLEDKIEITSIKLSKQRLLGKVRKHQYREAWLPLVGERAPGGCVEQRAPRNRASPRELPEVNLSESAPRVVTDPTEGELQCPVLSDYRSRCCLRS